MTEGVKRCRGGTREAKRRKDSSKPENTRTLLQVDQK
jgi:hypothetical protein